MNANKFVMKKHIYKDNLIFEYEEGSFLATAVDIDGDPIEKSCKSLGDAKQWIDNVQEKNASIYEDLKTND